MSNFFVCLCIYCDHIQWIWDILNIYIINERQKGLSYVNVIIMIQGSMADLFVYGKVTLTRQAINWIHYRFIVKLYLSTNNEYIQKINDYIYVYISKLVVDNIIYENNIFYIVLLYESLIYFLMYLYSDHNSHIPIDTQVKSVPQRTQLKGFSPVCGQISILRRLVLI